MERMSFKKRLPFSTLQYEEFQKFAGEFLEAFNSVCPGGSTILIKLYEHIPFYSTKPLPPLMRESLERINECMVARTFSDLKELTRELYSSAAYIEMRITPISENAPQYAFGHISCKGFLPKHILFYVQPEELASKVMQRMLERRGVLSKLKYAIGDGFEWNTHRIHIFTAIKGLRWKTK